MVPSTSRYRADISFSILHYFLISTSNESKLIYLFITETPEGEIKTQLCIEDTALPVNYGVERRRYASCQLSELTTLAFRASLKNSLLLVNCRSCLLKNAINFRSYCFCCESHTAC